MYTLKRPTESRLSYQQHLVGMRPPDITPGMILAARRKERTRMLDANEKAEEERKEREIRSKQRRRQEMLDTSYKM